MGIGMLLVSLFTFVELNCENLFDCRHDSLKNDYEFLPESNHHWTPSRYWRKVNHIGQEIVACGGDSTDYMLPDMVALCEVENDSTLFDLTKRSLLRTARYEYLMTDSPDQRGIDVALLYSPFSFLPISHYSIRVTPTKDMHPTRDILYVCGQIISGDTLHVFVVHAPSRMGGEMASRPHRMVVMERLAASVDSLRMISPDAKILIAGDFNDYAKDKPLQKLYSHGLENISKDARGSNGSKGTYRFQGEWGSLDQIICSPNIAKTVKDCRIGDKKFLLEEDKKYGGFKPYRTYYGPRYQRGYSDHLPLIARFEW